MEINRIIDLYKKRESQRHQNMMNFYYGDRDFLVVQRSNLKIFGPCNSVDMIVGNNLSYIEGCLQNDFTDDLPFLEPWVGVGVYANAFGCDYIWSDNEAPQTTYKYHKVEEVKEIEQPDWRKSPVMQMVIDCIDALKEKTNSEIPLVLTDTQSPFDTATLVLDACEFFMACHSQEDIIFDFMEIITDLVIEFTKVQIEHIGEELLARPGHNLISCRGFEGIAISEDNFAVSSPSINKKVAFRFNQKLIDEFGGVGVHSCGRWTETMKLLSSNTGVKSIDCALGRETDPTPNDPVEVRNALKDSKIIAKVRVGNRIKEIEVLLNKFIDPNMKVVVELDYDPNFAELNYKRVKEQLFRLYQSKVK